MPRQLGHQHLAGVSVVLVMAGLQLSRCALAVVSQRLSQGLRSAGLSLDTSGMLTVFPIRLSSCGGGISRSRGPGRPRTM